MLLTTQSLVRILSFCFSLLWVISPACFYSFLQLFSLSHVCKLVLFFFLSFSFSKTIQINIIDDEEYEKNKNFFLEIGEPQMVEMSERKGGMSSSPGPTSWCAAIFRAELEVLIYKASRANSPPTNFLNLTYTIKCILSLNQRSGDPLPCRVYFQPVTVREVCV